MATLNIGLAVNGGGRIGVGEALAAIRTIGGEEPETREPYAHP